MGLKLHATINRADSRKIGSDLEKIFGKRRFIPNRIPFFKMVDRIGSIKRIV